ncbi:MAG: hypothetical protein R3185_06905 [Candidatus Thermoplasmatota archaeon]|nr:hypothetical protein [Candidatus Thermoplasmatota archaeon]
MHEAPEYRSNDACYVSVTCMAGLSDAGGPGVETQGFVRVNGNGTDLNRQYPTTGLGHPSWPAMTEPEIRAQVAYFDTFQDPVLAGVDLHGMLEAENFTYLMIKDTQRTLDEVLTHEAVARTTYQWIDQDPALDPWRPRGPVSIWGATYDLLGYSAPGTGGGYIVQDVGLNAPGFTVEMAYNHITFDNHYPGPGQQFNIMHVAALRDIVVGFIDYAFQAPGAAVLGGEATIGYLAHPTVIEQGRFNGEDADPNQLFDELASHGANIQELTELTPAALEGLTHVILPDQALGASMDQLASSGEGASQADPVESILVPWVEQGGTLVLTDAAVELAVELGLAEEVTLVEDVTGKADMVDLDHPLAEGANAPVQSLVDGNPLNYASGEVPNHCLVDFEGEAVGTRTLGAAMPTSQAGTCTMIGEASRGEGTVRVMGVALPAPVEKGDHGVDSYALTPNGFRILLNLLDTPLQEAGTDEAQGSEAGANQAEQDPSQDIPAAGLLTLGAVLGAAMVAARRRT